MDDEPVEPETAAEEASRLMRKAAALLRTEEDGPEAWGYIANRVDEMAGWVDETVEKGPNTEGEDERG